MNPVGAGPGPLARSPGRTPHDGVQPSRWRPPLPPVPHPAVASHLPWFSGWADRQTPGPGGGFTWVRTTQPVGIICTPGVRSLENEPSGLATHGVLSSRQKQGGEQDLARSRPQRSAELSAFLAKDSGRYHQRSIGHIPSERWQVEGHQDFLLESGHGTQLWHLATIAEVLVDGVQGGELEEYLV